MTSLFNHPMYQLLFDITKSNQDLNFVALALYLIITIFVISCMSEAMTKRRK